jgi:hypothetical protein
MIVTPSLIYNPEAQQVITSYTKLAKGITIAKFLGARGDRTSFRHVKFEDQRREIARNLTLHARAMDLINGNTYRFNDVRVIVSEGIYNRLPIDAGSSVMAAKAFGRLVYYQVIGTNGKIDFEKTFDVAEFWNDHLKFDEMYLDYDDYNADGSLTAQIGILMPAVPEDFNIPDKEFGRKIFTVFNNEVFQKKELIEILPKEPEEIVTTPDNN